MHRVQYRGQASSSAWPFRPYFGWLRGQSSSLSKYGHAVHGRTRQEQRCLRAAHGVWCLTYHLERGLGALMHRLLCCSTRRLGPLTHRLLCCSTRRLGPTSAASMRVPPAPTAPLPLGLCYSVPLLHPKPLESLQPQPTVFSSPSCVVRRLAARRRMIPRILECRILLGDCLKPIRLAACPAASHLPCRADERPPTALPTPLRSPARPWVLGVGELKSTECRSGC